MRRYLKFLGKDTYAFYLFHGLYTKDIDDPHRNTSGKHLQVDLFEELIDMLCIEGTPITIEDIVKKTPLPENAFIISFDDACLSAYVLGVPILERYDCPAVFYITSGFVSGAYFSWADQLEIRFGSCAKAMFDTIIRWKLDPYEYLKKVDGQVGSQLDIDQYMTSDHVKALARDPLFTIGGHGHSHKIMENLSDQHLDSEILTSIGCLKSLLNQQIRHYAYPQGLPGCEQTASALKKEGIICCPTAIEGVNKIGDDLFKLKRVLVV